MKFLQFYLWWDCNNNCDFCFAKLLKQSHKSTKEERIKAIEYVINKLQEEHAREFEVVSLIGGEFFENQIQDNEVNNKFMELIDLCINLIKKNQLKMLYLMTHLIYSDTKYLYQVINEFKKHNIIDKLLICSSFDPWGRFHTEERKSLWYSNINTLLKDKIQLHVEFILNQHLIDSILNKSLDMNYFKDNNIRIDFLNPQGFFSLDCRDTDSKEETLKRFNNNWLPTRESFIKFLFWLLKFNPIQLKKLFSLEVRAQELHFISHGNVTTRDVNTYDENIGYNDIKECGHSDKFSFYCDSDKCMVCDIQEFINSWC